jgi:hypothetical protein
MLGVKVFWTWLHQLVQSDVENEAAQKVKIELVSNGILGFIQNPERASEVDEKIDVLGVTVYKSNTRQQIVDFCGWFQNRSKANRKVNKKFDERC